MRLSKTECKQIWEQSIEGLNLKGYSTIDFLTKENPDGSIVIFHVGQWKEERTAGTFDYDMLILDKDNNIVYDESNGELKKGRVYEVYESINGIKYY